MESRVSTGAPRVFEDFAAAEFERLYPERSGTFTHSLASDPRLELNALADLAESLAPSSVEYNAGDLPIGIDPAQVPRSRISIGDAIRSIETAGTWAVLKNVESHPSYRALLMDLLAELELRIAARTGAMLRPQAYIFISSPHAVTPFHFDPEHNILLQLRGSKTMTTFPAGTSICAPDVEHERYHRGGHRNLAWQDHFSKAGMPHELTPGTAIYVPVMAPHFVENGPQTSVSLSITWRSRWSMDEANARALNGWLRERGITPADTKRFPTNNAIKSLSWKIVRRLGAANGASA